MTATQTVSAAFLDLLPVVAGGIIGVLGGLVGNAYSHHLVQREQRSLERRSKLEQIVNAICEADVWVRKEEGQYLYNEGDNFEHSPIIRIEALVGLYFPELHPTAIAFYSATQKYRLWLMDCSKEATDTGKKHLSSERLAQHKDLYSSFALTREMLLKEARGVMARELSPNNSFKGMPLRGTP